MCELGSQGGMDARWHCSAAQVDLRMHSSVTPLLLSLRQRSVQAGGRAALLLEAGGADGSVSRRVDGLVRAQRRLLSERTRPLWLCQRTGSVQQPWRRRIDGVGQVTGLQRLIGCGTVGTLADARGFIDLLTWTVWLWSSSRPQAGPRAPAEAGRSGTPRRRAPAGLWLDSSSRALLFGGSLSFLLSDLLQCITIQF